MMSIFVFAMPFKRSLFSIFFWLVFFDAQASLPEVKTSVLSEGYGGSETCQTCHADVYQAWKGSHHQQAMMIASEESVLGDFYGDIVKDKHRTAQFYTKKIAGKKQFFVRTQDEYGEKQEYRIQYTFGVYPLQQYIVNFPKGRKQVLDIAWDARPKSQGGQTWFYLGSNHNAITSKTGQLMAKDHGEYFSSASGTEDSNFFWTGSFYNWNSRCASCHVTGFKKQYDLASGGYGRSNLDKMTTSNPAMDLMTDIVGELGVGCEACHGPAKGHLQWVKEVAQGKKTTSAHKKYSGFQYQIQDQGEWSPLAKAIHTTVAGKQNTHTVKDTFSRTGASASKQVEVCAGCHSRRLQLQDRDPNLAFTDNYMPMLIDESIYYSDGQSKDENFVWGSFAQSKMYQAGVVCSNCHDPHSVKLKGIAHQSQNSQGRNNRNVVCLQCHQASTYETKQHHKHNVSQAGSQCISCHMPATTFMNVDKRFDHSFKVPSGHISQKVDSPNACRACHDDKSTTWVEQALNAWYPNQGLHKNLRPQHQFSEAFVKHAKGDRTAPRTLNDIANSDRHTDIVRASALAKMSDGQSRLSLSRLPSRLKDPSELIRLGAVRSTSALPVEHKVRLLTPLFSEKNRSVRIEIGRQLASLPIAFFPKNQQKSVQGMFDDLIQSARYNGDASSNLVMLADFYFVQGQLEKAERYYLKALDLQKEDEAALLNLADLYRALETKMAGQDKKGLTYIKRAVSAHPRSANARYVLGLYYVRHKNMGLAERQLKKAWEFQGENLNYAYAYGLVLKEQNKRSLLNKLVDDWKIVHGSHPYMESLMK